MVGAIQVDESANDNAVPVSRPLKDPAGGKGHGQRPGYGPAWLASVLAITFMAVQIWFFPAITRIDYSGLIAETIICLIPLAGLFLVQDLRQNPHVYWPLLAGLAALLLSHVADALDEVRVQPKIVGILVEDGLALLGYGFLIWGVVRWIHFNRRLLREIRGLKDDLERRVVERTAKLEAEMAKRQRAKVRLRASERRYRELNAVLEQRVAERTAEVQAANDLSREREERLEFVLEGSRLGTWDWNIATGEVNRNAYWAEMLGFTHQEIDGAGKEGWLALIHPEDRECAWRSIDDHLAGRTPLHEAEYRMRTREGGYRWILDRARIAHRDAEGRPLRMSGTHEDITERKRYEAELNRAREAAEAAARALESANAELQRLATTDRLTGIWNRAYFEEAAAKEIERALRYGEPLSLLLFDIDLFKIINDTHGHLVGDQVLVELARRVGQNLRALDVLARWGGEEFVVMLPHSGAAEAMSAAEKLRVLIQSTPFPAVGQVTSSFGVALFRPADNLDIWLKRADDALYMAKAAGRNQVCPGDEGLAEG